MELTAEQAQKIRAQPNSIVEVEDPQTHQRYVILTREMLDALLEEIEDNKHAAGWKKATGKGMALILGEDE